VIAGQFDGDANLDMVGIADTLINAVSFYHGNGDGTFTCNGIQMVILPATVNPVTLVSGLFNGDTLPDIALGNFGGSISILLHQ